MYTKIESTQFPIMLCSRKWPPCTLPIGARGGHFPEQSMMGICVLELFMSAKENNICVFYVKKGKYLSIKN